MKKIIFGGIAIVAIAVAIAFSLNVKTTESGLSDLALSNVEALADKPKPPNPGLYCPICDKCEDHGNSACDKNHDW